MADHTRRSWMVTIGQATAGVGLAGNIQADDSDTKRLPAGLYEPSSDHLGHALMSTEIYHPVPPNCPTDYIRPRSGLFKPESFVASEFVVVRRLAQLILGESATQEEETQHVAEWIDLRVSSARGVREATLKMRRDQRRLSDAYHGPVWASQLETEDPAGICREGLAWLEDAGKAQYSMSFIALKTEQQVAILDTVSDERREKNLENAGTKFFKFLKAETIRGFYTSRVGLKELDFKGNAFYARSPGCHSK